jgi:GNAT superfamily N-acetyltransferase
MNTPTLRAATPADVDAVQAFVRALSIESRTRRFFAPVRELSPALVQALVGRDPRHHFVVMLDGSRVIGLGQYARLASCADSADFALVVADDWQGWGLGRRILEHLVAEARAAGLQQLRADVMSGNRPMLKLVRSLGFDIAPNPLDDELMQVTRALAPARAVTCGARRLAPLPLPA